MDLDESVRRQLDDLLAPGETVLGSFPLTRPRSDDEDAPEAQRTLLVTSARLLLTTLDPHVLDNAPRVMRHRSLLLRAVLGVTWESVPVRHRESHPSPRELPPRSTLSVGTASGEFSWTLEDHDGARRAQRVIVEALGHSSIVDMSG